MLIDIQKFNELVDSGVLTRREKNGLYIWNYTPKCQFEKLWSEESLIARGLITDFNGRVIARPFPKFFNLEEHKGPIPDDIPQIFEKIDGSLGILYFNPNPQISTRGAFESKQAIEANKILDEILSKQNIPFQKDRTYLFEIIYPENKIVVDYGQERKLVLLAIIDIETGQEIEIDPVQSFFERPQAFEAKTWAEIEILAKQEKENAEGYVLRWPNGFRLKMKLAAYVRLHRLVTGLTSRRIWDLLRNNQLDELQNLTQHVPEEFHFWIKKTCDDFINQFNKIESKARLVLSGLSGTRAEMAKKLKKEDKIIFSVVFLMLDGRKYDEVIWKSLKPGHERAFKTDDS